MQLQGKNIVLTGASRGFGKYLAGRLWDEGANLLLVSRSVPPPELPKRIGQYWIIAKADLTWFGAASSILSTVAESWSIDGLINNAAIQGPVGNTWDIDLAELNRTIAVDLFAPIDLCRLIVPGMIKQGHGKIVNLSGGGAAGPRPNYSAYATAKAGLVRFSECLAEELRGTGIDVNCVAPGAMPTGMLDPDAAPPADDAMEKAADLIVFLLSDASNGITGKLISAVWDDWRNFDWDDPDEKDTFTLRRVVPKI